MFVHVASMLDSMGYLIPLGTAVVLMGVLGRFAWGLLSRRRRERQRRNRIRVEDALKHLYYCETEARHPTLTSIAGRLQVPENQAAELMQTMQARGLVQWVPPISNVVGAPAQWQGEQLQLTPDGRAYALHIVRAHRHWERYLADKTGYAETDWHAQADQIEHHLTSDDMDELAGRLGYPLMDPHGDPIPTPRGELAGKRGQPLTTLAAGEAGRITHLEDEPEVVYAQLVAEGFYPGLLVHVIDRSQDYVRIWAAGDEHRLAPIVAAAVAVEPVGGRDMAAPIESLADLAPQQQGRIRELSPRCRGAERRRLLDLGIVPGTVVTAELVGPGGDPTAYRIRDTLIALRREQASLIKIDRLPPEPAQDERQHELSGKGDAFLATNSVADDSVKFRACFANKNAWWECIVPTAYLARRG